ncbi:MAG TPA: glycosyltransferase [Stenotrophomonas sp.]|jgi:glycosyltransferase involved in cell wall biosynthesis
MTLRDRPVVMFYLPEMKVGGAEISLLRLAQGLREHGVRCVFVIHRVDAAATQLAGDLELVSLDADRTLSAARRLVALLRQRPPHVLVSALTHTNIVAAIAARLAGRGTRVVVTEHAPVSSMRQIDASRTYAMTVALMPWAYRLAHAVIAVSQGVHDDLQPALGKAVRRRSGIIANPVLRDDWQALSQAPVDDAWFRDDRAPVVLSVGRLSREKDFALLIRAFSQLPPSLEACRLAIIGEGPERGALQALIDELGLATRVRLLGQQANPFAFMRRATVFALTSRFEGFGNVLVEAMACGLPVISTDCPVGPREILCDGRFGTLVPLADVQALASALGAAVQDPRPADGATARALEFGAEHSVRQYLALFTRLSSAFADVT